MDRDLDVVPHEARLRRLARIYVGTLDQLSPDEWDLPRGEEWTVRRIVEHVAPPWYAEQVGDLTQQRRLVRRHNGDTDACR